jgi:cytoskeletal protein CcmA (bactofilin family)
MERKRLIPMGFLAVFLTFALCGLTYGGEAGNFRSGANVKVAAGETVAGGLVAAGANVEVLGNVEGGLKACGANIVISGDVQGGLKAFGANMVLSGSYHSKVMAAGANVTLSGVFDEDVEVGGARVTVARTALIKGNLIYTAADLNLQKGSRIMGEVVQKQVMVKKERAAKWGRRGILALFPLGIFFWLISMASLVIVGVIINYLLFPKKTNVIVDTISQSPWKSLWFGLIFLVVVPVAIIIAFITVVGVPTAFFWPLVVGVIIIALISLIPFIGWLFRLFVLLISLGALWTVVWKAVPVPAKRRTQRKPQRRTRKKR